MADVAVPEMPRTTSVSSFCNDKVVTLGLLERTASKKRCKGESADKWVAKATHLHLEGKELTRLGPILLKCTNLKQLYCYDNKIDFLDQLPPKVEAVYLDDNLLDCLELDYLPNLRTLSAKNNRIQEIESLGGPIEELQLSGQRIFIAPHVLPGLAHTLQILNLSQCHLTSLECMSSARGYRLSSLDVSKNLMESVDDAIPALRLCMALRTLFVAGNPFCRQAKFRDSLIVEVPGPLEEVDDKAITSAEKQYLKVIIQKRKSLQR